MEGKYIYVVAQLEEVHNNTNAVCITKGLNTKYMPVFDTYLEATKHYPEATILSILWEDTTQAELS